MTSNPSLDADDHRTRVLFVDDEQSMLSALRRILFVRRGEWDMHFALGGQQGLMKMAEQPFDVVVTDMRMPDVDGAVVLEETANNYRSTGRVLLSGYAESELSERGVKLADRVLSKPCDPETLRAAIESACEAGRARSE